MNLKTKKRIAAKVLKCSPKKVKLNTDSLEKIGEAITRSDIKALVSKSQITKVKAVGVSRVRAKKKAEQKKKGRSRGQGLRKGKLTARSPAKLTWMNKIRNLRELLFHLKEAGKLDNANFRDLYMKSKGGYFRSRRHLKLYIDEHEMIIKKE
jgi:large subunit ribosomal protein L19e